MPRVAPNRSRGRLVCRGVRHAIGEGAAPRVPHPRISHELH